MDKDIGLELEKLVEAGLCQKHGQEGFSLTDAGKDYFESIIMGGVEGREHIYALGRVQGLREAENDAKYGEVHLAVRDERKRCAEIVKSYNLPEIVKSYKNEERSMMINLIVKAIEEQDD